MRLALWAEVSMLVGLGVLEQTSYQSWDSEERVSIVWDEEESQELFTMHSEVRDEASELRNSQDEGAGEH